jgi:hypothetical protein
MKISVNHTHAGARVARVSPVAALLLGGVALLLLPTGCHDGDEDQLKAYADSFSTAYFNWQFAKAQPYCTPESRIWLLFASSQVTQEDVDSLRAQPEGASVKIEDVDYDSDTSAVVSVTVRNFLPMDTIGKRGPAVERADYLLSVCYRDSLWRVRALPKRRGSAGAPQPKE